MNNRLKKNSSYFIAILSLFFCLNNNPVMAQPTEWKLLSEVEVEQQIKAGKDFDAQGGHISGVSLGNLLKKYASQDNKSVEQIYIQNAVIDDKLELISVTIPYQLSLENCTFTDDVDFSYSVFKKSLSLKGSTDENKYSTFNGKANFYKMSVDGDFRVENTIFMSKEKPIHFNYITVSGTFFLDKAALESPFTFDNSVMNEFECTGTHFNNKAQFLDDKKSEENASFYSVNVRGNATFSRTVFEGPANFRNADIAKTLEMTGTHFNDSHQDIKFGRMKVKGDAIFNKTVFASGFDMSNVEVGGTLSFQGTEANKDKATKTFAGMKVDTFVFDPANLAAPYSLQDAEYRLLNQTPAVDNKKLLDLIEKSDYSQSTYNNMAAYYKRVGREEAADDVYVLGKLREGSELGWRKYLLNRLLYWTVGYGKYPWRALYWSLGFIVIGCLVFFSKDNMIMDEKYKKAVPERTQDPSILKALLSMLLDPFTSTIYSIFVDVKTWITKPIQILRNRICSSDKFVNPKPRTAEFFSVLRNKLCLPDTMSEENKKVSGEIKTDFKYDPLWYSIALFLPIVDLEDAKIWTPNPKCKWRRHYMRVHIILGYLLIPIGLAAWTGLIK